LALVLIAYFTSEGFERLAMALAGPPERGESMLLRDPGGGREFADGVSDTWRIGFTDDLVEFFAEGEEEVVISHREEGYPTPRQLLSPERGVVTGPSQTFKGGVCLQW